MCRRAGNGVLALADLATELIHAPWEAGSLELAARGVTLGVDYPEPIVDHSPVRQVAIDAYERAGNGSS